jgi:uncharacterized membrane protein
MQLYVGVVNVVVVMMMMMMMMIIIMAAATTFFLATVDVKPTLIHLPFVSSETWNTARIPKKTYKHQDAY